MTTELSQELFEYEETGQVGGSLVQNAISFGLLIVILVFMVVLAAKVYESQEADIATISDANVSSDVTASIRGGFSAMETFASNLDIVAIAVIFGIALFVILGVFGLMGGDARGGGFSAI